MGGGSSRRLAARNAGKSRGRRGVVAEEKAGFGWRVDCRSIPVGKGVVTDDEEAVGWGKTGSVREEMEK